MFENIQNAQVGHLSDEDLALALGDDADVTGGKKKDETKAGKTDKDKKSTTKSAAGTPGPKKEVSVMSDKDLEEAVGDDDDDDDDDNDDNQDDKKKKKTAKKVEKKEDEDEKDEDDDDDDEKNEDDDDDEDQEDKKKKSAKEDDDDDEQPEGAVEIKDFLAARAELLIKKGFWVEWDGWEDTEWDEDTWADMEVKQRELQIQEDREGILESFGPYGQKIADYASQGGDPDKLIDIFKEQRKVESLSIETEDAQKAVVLKYVTEFQNMKPKQAQTYINALIADKELEATAEEAKTEMEKELKQQEKDLIAQQIEAAENAKAAQQESIKKFSAAVVSYVNGNNEIPADEKKDIIKVLTKYDRKLKDGTPINDFTIKFTEFRKDLPNYIEFVRFVLDPKKYKKSAETKGKSEANEKAFRLIRTANKTKKGGGSSSSRSDDKPKGSKFKLLY